MFNARLLIREIFSFKDCSRVKSKWVSDCETVSISRRSSVNSCIQPECALESLKAPRPFFDRVVDLFVPFQKPRLNSPRAAFQFHLPEPFCAPGTVRGSSRSFRCYGGSVRSQNSTHEFEIPNHVSVCALRHVRAEDSRRLFLFPAIARRKLCQLRFHLA